MEHNLLSNVKITQLSTMIVASSTDHYFNAVDMRGYQGVAFVTGLYSTTTTGSTGAEVVYAQMSATSSGTGTWVDCYGSTVSYSSDFANQPCPLAIDVYRPHYRWVRPYIDRNTTDLNIPYMFAIQYRAEAAAIAQSTTYVADYAIVVGTSS